MKLVHGVGINDADYSVDVKIELPKINGKRNRKQYFLCPYYTVWKSMLTRCYSQKYHNRNPSYINVSVCEDWLTFSKFREWMVNQDWTNKHLDKDIKGDGSLYSPETCIFVNQIVNNFVVNMSETSGVYYNGYSFISKGKDANNKSVHLGSFCNWVSARNSYIEHKTKQIENFYDNGEITSDIRNLLLNKYNTQV